MNLRNYSLSPFSWLSRSTTSTALISVLMLIATIGFSQNYQWAFSIGSNQDERGLSIASDNAGNVYITGSFEANCDFDPGPGTANLTNNGYEDIYIAKYDSSGNFIWAIGIGSIGDDAGNAITIDDMGNVIVTGKIGGAVDFDPGPDTADVTGWSNAVFVAKYDSDGNYIYASAMKGSSSVFGNSVAVDSDGNAFITGRFNQTVDFDPGPNTVDITASGGYDLFIAKYDLNGDYLWAHGLGGASIDQGYGIAVDGAGNAIITGHFNDTADFDPGTGTANLISKGSYEIFIAKYDPNGNYIWAKGIESTYTDQGRMIATDASGNVFITGIFGDTADFDPGSGTANLISGGFSDMFIAKYDANGNYVWAKRIGGVDNESPRDIVIGNTGNIYVTGTYASTTDFDPGTGVVNLSANGSSDIFYAKYDSDGNYVWAKGIGGTWINSARGITLDGLGDLVITGYFGSTMDFDPDGGTANLNLVGGTDIYVAKYSAGEPVGINNIGIASNKLSVYPNPAGEVLFIESNTVFKSVDVHLTNVLGQVFTYHFKKNAELKIHISELPNGMYFIDTDNTFFGKVVINH